MIDEFNEMVRKDKENESNMHWFRMVNLSRTRITNIFSLWVKKN
jgi:hypothetical protein